MKKKEVDLKKGMDTEKDLRNEVDQEEVLDLDSLFDVQGGQNDKGSSKCGLGCFSGAVYQQDQSEK